MWVWGAELSGGRSLKAHLDIGLHRNSALLGRAQSLHHSFSGSRSRFVPAVRDLPGQDSGGADRAAEVQMANLRYTSSGVQEGGVCECLDLGTLVWVCVCRFRGFLLDCSDLLFRFSDDVL